MKILILFIILYWALSPKKPTEYLYCGLFGWIGKNPATFNRHAFSILGLSNESRGGDSCGVYSDRHIVYGTGFTKDFPSFIKKVTPIKSGKDCVVMGHTRKASIGTIDARNAHPIGLKNPEGNLGFILTHNGTLVNHYELAKRHGINTKGLKTDSQILAALIYHSEAGFELLGHYNGAAALAFHFVGTNTLFLFKGKSKSSENYYYETEERPLYGYQESEHSFYYSSLKSPLEVIAKKENQVFDLSCNTLYQITAGVIEDKIAIPRDKAFQKKSTYTWSGQKARVWKDNRWINERYDPYDDDPYEGYGPMAYGYSHKKSGHSEVVKGTETEYCSPPISIYSEALIHLGTGMLAYTKGRYHLGENLAHGKVIVNDIGLILDPKGTKKDELYTLYFWEGILLHDERTFETIKQLKNENHHVSIYEKELLSGTPYPVSLYKRDVQYDPKLYGYDFTFDTHQEFSGKFTPVFCNKTYTVRNGLISAYTKRNVMNKLKNKNVRILAVS